MPDHNAKGLKILFVAESFSPKRSGGSVTLRMANAMKDSGAFVKIFRTSSKTMVTECNDFNENNATAFKARAGRYLHIIPGQEIKVFRKVVDEFQPNVIHVCSLEYAKSRFFLKCAHKRNIQTVVQPWRYTFFCDQIFDYRNGSGCGKCVSGQFYNAWRYRCGKRFAWYRITKRISRPLLRAISRSLLRHDVLNSDVFLSTNSHMDQRFISYGVPEEKITRLPLPFDPSRIEGPTVSSGEDFIYYTHIDELKGSHFLPQVINSCPSTKFSLYPIIASEEHFKDFKNKLNGENNVKIDASLSWYDGLADQVAACRGVLMTTLWPTTTEYALLEAMAFSKPIVAFDVGVHRDILVNRKNAMVVPSGNIQAFIDAVRELDQDEQLRVRLGQAANRTFKELVDQSKLSDILIKSYLGNNR